MAERSLVAEGHNPVWLALVVAMWLAVAAVLFGPGRGALLLERERVASFESRLAAWKLEFSGGRELTENEVDAWHDTYHRLRAFGAPGAEETRLTGWVAGALRMASVRRLDVGVVANQSVVAPEYRLYPPNREGARIVLRTAPVRARFDARFEDVAALIARIETDGSALVIRELTLERLAPDVRVDMLLEVWTHQEAGS